MLLDEFDYQLPQTAIAQEPLDDRSSARLLVDVDGRIDHRTCLLYTSDAADE